MNDMMNPTFPAQPRRAWLTRGRPLTASAAVALSVARTNVCALADRARAQEAFAAFAAVDNQLDRFFDNLGPAPSETDSPDELAMESARDAIVALIENGDLDGLAGALLVDDLQRAYRLEHP